jgi:hypothetical protein
MRLWLLYCVGTMILWGFWGFLGKISALHLQNKNLLVIACLGFANAFPIVSAIFPKYVRFKIGNPYSYHLAACLSAHAVSARTAGL